MKCLMFKEGIIFGRIICAILVVSSYSCSKSPLPVIEPVSTGVEIQGGVSGNSELITVEVSFSSPVSGASAAITPLKYNKTSVINFEFDDNPAASFAVYQYLNSQTFSNGTGKAIKFRAGVAVNSRGNYNNGDLWENYQGSLTKEQAAAMISGGWTLENHGFYHSVLNASDNFGYGKQISLNISENTKYVFDKTGFRMRTLVVPSNDPGYLSPAFEQGIIATTSTNHFEGFQSFPMYGDFVDIAGLPLNKIHLRRDFNDKWDISGINMIKDKISALLNKSSTKERILYRLGTHSPNLEAFKELSEHIKNNAKDQMWVTTMQEMVEYLQLRNQISKTETMVNGKLLINLDISGVDKDTFFKDFTLMINAGSAIKDIKVTNAKESSFNLNGLVNISF